MAFARRSFLAVVPLSLALAGSLQAGSKSAGTERRLGHRAAELRRQSQSLAIKSSDMYTWVGHNPSATLPRQHRQSSSEIAVSR